MRDNCLLLFFSNGLFFFGFIYMLLFVSSWYFLSTFIMLLLSVYFSRRLLLAFLMLTVFSVNNIRNLATLILHAKICQYVYCFVLQSWFFKHLRVPNFLPWWFNSLNFVLRLLQIWALLMHLLIICCRNWLLYLWYFEIQILI